jgi:hypothetical protein
MCKMGQMGKNDVSWNILFQELDILKGIAQNGFFEISSSRINTVRESRLMTKFDHKANLPQIFKDHNLSILPITRGSYIIAPFDAYQEITYNHNVKPTPIHHRYDLESLDFSNLYSEAAALNYAACTGILNEVLGEACEFTVS